MSRLSWARGRLRSRLARRGLTLSASTVTATVLQNAAPAAVPFGIVASTARHAAAFVAKDAAVQISSQVLALVEGVVQGMVVTKMKYVAVAMLVVAALGGGTGIIMREALAQKPADISKRRRIPTSPLQRPRRSLTRRMKKAS